MSDHQELADLIWTIADALRGSFKSSEYGSVILPFVVLRRLDCLKCADERPLILGPVDRATGAKHLQPLQPGLGSGGTAGGPELSDFVLAVVHRFPADLTSSLALFDLDNTVRRLERAGLLRHVIDSFATIDLGPAAVTVSQMGQIFDELVQLVMQNFGGPSAGEHYSPPDVIGLMTSLLLGPERERPSRASAEVQDTVPACGMGELFSAFDLTSAHFTHSCHRACLRAGDKRPSMRDRPFAPLDEGHRPKLHCLRKFTEP